MLYIIQYIDYQLSVLKNYQLSSKMYTVSPQMIINHAKV